MGILSWLLGAVVALISCRFIPLGRPAGRLPEAIAGVVFALGGGLVATRLDFGGWNAFELRAALFCAMTTLCGVAIFRCAGALGSRR
jgi:uncharacterized membrane protein YeaQ/YmgE (transglycosylase-associated protein family)